MIVCTSHTTLYLFVNCNTIQRGGTQRIAHCENGKSGQCHRPTYCCHYPISNDRLYRHCKKSDILFFFFFFTRTIPPRPPVSHLLVVVVVVVHQLAAADNLTIAIYTGPGANSWPLSYLNYVIINKTSTPSDCVRLQVSPHLLVQYRVANNQN